MARLLGEGCCEVGEEGYRGDGGDFGLNRAGCPSTRVFIRHLLSVHLMFHPAPSWSHNSILIFAFIKFTTFFWRPIPANLAAVICVPRYGHPKTTRVM